MLNRSVEVLLQLLNTKVVAELSDIQEALNGASRATAFRYLTQVPYRRSYNRNGRYYCLDDPKRFNRIGVWCHQGVCFSRDETLGVTVMRLVRDSEQGCTHRELQGLLRVRVQSFLLDAVAHAQLLREQVDGLYVYFHTDPAIQQAQFTRRKQQIASGQALVVGPDVQVDDAVVVQILLVLIHHPGSKAADVVRHLRGHLPPITFEQVRAVFCRYDLDSLGEKGGASTC